MSTERAHALKNLLRVRVHSISLFDRRKHLYSFEQAQEITVDKKQDLLEYVVCPRSFSEVQKHSLLQSSSTPSFPLNLNYTHAYFSLISY